MRNSPRKRGSGAVSCSTPVEIFTTQQLIKIPLGELRNLASEKHGIQNAGLMKKPELHRKLKEHFEHRHGVNLKGWEAHLESLGGLQTQTHHTPDSSLPISQTIDRLRNRIKDKTSNQTEETVIEEVVDGQDTIIETVAEEVVESSSLLIQESCEEEMVVEEHHPHLHHPHLHHHQSSDKLMELAELATPDHHNTPSSSNVAALHHIHSEREADAVTGRTALATQMVSGTSNHLHDEEDEESTLHIAETSTAVATITHADTSPPPLPSQTVNTTFHQEVVTEEVIEHSSGDNIYEEYITSDNVGDIVESEDISHVVVGGGDDDEEVEDDDVGIGLVTSTTDAGGVATPLTTQNRIVYHTKLDGVENLVGDPTETSSCRGYVVAASVKELRDLGRDMLRIHAENHGIEHAGRLRMPDLLKEVIQHYNGVHRAGLELTRLEMLKLNMLKLRKVKVPVREKTPPPDFTNVIPKNVVPLEEQVHHVYEKRPDVCTVDIIVDNLKDMLALGTSILRPEASKHRVANSSRKQKLQVVEELWEHYLKFHLKGTAAAMAKGDPHHHLQHHQQHHHATHGGVVEEEYESDVSVFHEYQDSQSSGFIVVREEDIVQGEEIQAVAEEIAE
eukprot:TRINITY_DN5799_c0_g1_i1.p1 TRINITY_DN5799_c0_g1~~TRINITY_DN5799_c0_g1_i1.p1  ORF type:complete len:619 (+),score=173.67 TRINITY_DN5799_c0_g1_i1:103-1959(+)